MAITLADFNKIWASTSPLTPYSFSESNYKQGWNFIGSTPPARQMWDYLQKNNDEKMQYLANNYLPLSGGQLSGESIIGRANGTFVIKAGNADNALSLYGGTTNQNGASLILYGDNHSSSFAQGRFLLRAIKGSDQVDLIGLPGGTLTWGGNNVITSAGGNLNAGSTYMNDGKQIKREITPSGVVKTIIYQASLSGDSVHFIDVWIGRLGGIDVACKCVVKTFNRVLSSFESFGDSLNGLSNDTLFAYVDEDKVLTVYYVNKQYDKAFFDSRVVGGAYVSRNNIGTTVDTIPAEAITVTRK